MNRVRLFDKASVVFDQEIGSGSFGRVYKASISESRFPVVAIKIFSEEVLQEHTLNKVYDELSKVASLEHDNVVKLIGMVKERIPWLVFEYMKGGNLLQYVIRKKNTKEKKLIRYCRDICSGMAYLHRHQFLHRDLAARNILLSDNVAKIADLGLCSFLSEGVGTDYSVVGKMVAVRHAASECIVEAVYTPESDVWSFGVLMWEIWTGGQVPYGKELKEPEIRRLIAEGMNPAQILPPTCSPQIKSLMQAVLQVDRADRPTFHTLLMAFEEILDGHKIHLSRYQSNSPSKSPPFPISPVQSAYLVHSGRQVSHSPNTNQLLNAAVQHSNFLSTPDLKQAGNSPTRHPATINDARKSYGARRAATSSRDLLEIPPEVNMDRRYSEDSAQQLQQASSSRTGRHTAIQSSRLLSVSAQNLNNRLAKSQSDIREEMMRELIPNRFQKHRPQHY